MAFKPWQSIKMQSIHSTAAHFQWGNVVITKKVPDITGKSKQFYPPSDFKVQIKKKQHLYTFT